MSPAPQHKPIGWVRSIRHPCGCSFRHREGCRMRQKSRAKLRAGDKFTSLEELYDWLNLRTSIWVSYCKRPMPTAFIISQPYRHVMQEYRSGVYRKVTGYELEVVYA